MEKMEERYPARRPRNAERAKTSFSLESRGIKERGGEEGGGGRARDRWSLLVACRLPSTLDAVYSSYPSTHSSLGSAGPLALDGKHWPRRSTPRAQPVTWTRSLLRNTYLRASSSSLSSLLPPSLRSLFPSLPPPLAFLLPFTSLFPLSHHLDSFR